MPRIRKTQNQPTISRIVWRIAVYIRLSKDDGNDESLSVTNQRKIITEYIIADVYADVGLTGTDYERPEFQRLIHDVEAGTVNCIICKTLSRAFRNYSDQIYFGEKVFPLYDVRFISIGDPSLDTLKKNGSFWKTPTKQSGLATSPTRPMFITLAVHTSLSQRINAPGTS